jgi:hypothetical protein
VLHSTDESTTIRYKMAEIYMQLKQREVMEFLVPKGEKLICIHKCLLNTSGEVTANMSGLTTSVRD